MSEMAWKDLRDTDFSVLQTLGASWGSYIDAMVEQTEVLTEDVVKKHISADNYDSETAETVRGQVGLVADSFQDDLHEYAAIKVRATLEDAHTALMEAQEDLKALIEVVEAGKYEITGSADSHEVVASEELSGDIVDLNVSADLMDRAGVKESDFVTDFGQTESRSRLVTAAETHASELGEQLRDLMARAHEADDNAAAALQNMMDDPAEQPPPFGETYDDLIKGYEEDAAGRDRFGLLNEMLESDPPATPAMIHAWWDALNETEQDQFMQDHPELVGPTDGIPVQDRDTANHTLLDAELETLPDQIASLQAQLDAAGSDPNAWAQYDGTAVDYGQIQAQIAELEQRLDNAQALDARLDAGGPNEDTPLYLIDFDTSADGQAAVSVGDPDAADHTAVYVPGTKSDLEGVGGLIDDAAVMQQESHKKSPDEQTAVVMWLEYDAPDNAYPTHEGQVNPEAWYPSYANDARGDLNSFLNGIEASHDGDAHTTLIGHSYGSSVIGATAAEYEVAADQIIDYASPGLMVDRAEDLSVGADNVWSTRAERDVIAAPAEISGDLGLGGDPIDGDFGGNVFEAEAIGESGSDIHSGYLKDNADDEPNVALDTMALLITGQKG